MEQLTSYRPRPARFVLLALSAMLACGCANNSAPANAPANSANASVASNANSANAANAATGASKSPLEGIVRASADNVETRAGAAAQATVRLAITNGYHVNANPATEKFLIPTSLQVNPEAGITVDKIVYPKPLTKKFAFAEVPLAVYEGDARITMNVSVPRNAAPGRHTLGARLRVQPCDDEKCYPPMTIETSIPVTIR